VAHDPAHPQPARRYPLIRWSRLQARNEDEFAALRQARDAKLPMPKLILHALQVNMAGGRLPVPECNGVRYLKIPLNALPYAVWD
jgi:hypothetical protein